MIASFRGADLLRRKVVTKIVPALPPVTNGVGDYAFILAGELRKLGIESRFVVAGVPLGRSNVFSVGDFPFWVVPEERADALAEVLEDAGSDTVLLHFVGYAYAHWGLCSWLVDGLCRWKKRAPDRRLVTMFHELYAFGPPWRASFWTSPPQRRIARCLANASDAIVCGYALIERRLRAWRPRSPIRRMPIFSNVGELEKPDSLANRAPVAVVFGGAVTRRRFYEGIRDREINIRLLGVERIVDIGPSLAVPADIFGMPVSRRGVLSRSEVSAIMASAKVGLADYPLPVVAKSGILAAYHAHGLLTVNLSSAGEPRDDIFEGRHFVGLVSLKRGEFDPEAIAVAGYRWYRIHDRAKTATLFAKLLTTNKDVTLMIVN